MLRKQLTNQLDAIVRSEWRRKRTEEAMSTYKMRNTKKSRLFDNVRAKIVKDRFNDEQKRLKLLKELDAMDGKT